MTFKIENAEIGLSNTIAEEIETVYAIEARPENNRFVMNYSIERHLQVIGSNDEEHLVIRRKATNELIGYVILAGLSNPHQSLELRRIVIQSKGKGLGRQALKLIKQYCFDRLRFHRLWLDVYEDNERAIHLYRSEGFVEEGKLREIRKEDGRYRSMFIFSMLQNEYKPEKI